MDLNGDGRTDILSGSWPGELYFFPRNEEGKFTTREILKDKNGKDLKVGNASVVFAADWNGDGRLDLLCGNIAGEVYFIPNEGTGKKFAFGTPVKLEAGGEPIKVTHGDSGPAVADWDGDKVADLLVGAGDGSVLFYKNTGTAEKPKLAAGKAIVPPAPVVKNYMDGTKPGECGTRAKIAIVDWNNDGGPDLLLGDFAMRYGPEPKLSDEDKAAHKEAQQKYGEVVQQYSKTYMEQHKLGAAALASGVCAAADKLVPLQEKNQKHQEEMSKLIAALRKYERPYTMHGNVWLFVREPAAGK